MIYYISSEENRGVFNFVQDDEFIVAAGEVDLREKLVRRGGGFEHCRAVIVDIASAVRKTKNIPETLKSFKLMYPVKIICYNGGSEIGDNEHLINAGFYNIITSTTPEEIAREWAECLQGRTETEARTGKRGASACGKDAAPRRAGSGQICLTKRATVYCAEQI